MLFARADDGRWHAKWMHLGLAGHPHFNRVEGNTRSTSLLVRAIAERRYLQVAYLEGCSLRRTPNGRRAARSTVTCGLERPDDLPAGAARLHAREPARAAELGLEAMRELPSTSH